ncbi:MAG: sensor histidine kinase [Acidobacteriaceae bacterium]
MPALAKPSATLPRFVPHTKTEVATGAGSFLSDSPEARSEDLASLAHDARNVLSGLMLYSELIAAPGVLNAPHQHYVRELQDIAASAARLIDKMTASPAPKASGRLLQFQEEPTLPTATRVPLVPVPVTDAAGDLRRLQPLLAAVAGPAVRLAVATMPCTGRTALAVEDLTRILINLVRNAADAMPSGGHLRATAQYGDGASFLDSAASTPVPRSVLITVSDDGPGIPESLRERIFELGFSTRQKPEENETLSTRRRRGLGLNIVRNLVQAAGGSIRVTASHTGGARFEITLPLTESPAGNRSVLPQGSITSGTCSTPAGTPNPADSATKGA